MPGVALVAFAVGMLLLASVASAQNVEEGATQGATSPGTAAPVTNTPSGGQAPEGGATDGGSVVTGGTGSTSATDEDDSGDDDSDQLLGVLALIFGFAVIVALLHYLRKVQDKYYETSGVMVTPGTAIPKAISIGAFERDRDELAAEVEIKGPGVVVVGEAAQFKAVSGESDQVVDWTIERADDGTEQATLSAASGSETAVTAPAAGSYKLIAKQNGEVCDEVVFSAVVKASAQGDAKTVELPFVGEGYGTMVIAIAILSIAGALGFAGILETSAIATLLGAVAGYIFVSTSGGGGSSGSSPQAGSGA